MDEIPRRVWNNRPTEPINVRLLIQRFFAIVFADGSGLEDARKGRPAFLGFALFMPGHGDELLVQGWKDVGKIFVVALFLDAIYQLIVHRGVYVLEMLITATAMAIVPLTSGSRPCESDRAKITDLEQVMRKNSVKGEGNGDRSNAEEQS